MTRIPRKSDGRRIFTDAFKRKQIGRVLRGELTIAELGRKLTIAPSLLQRWKRSMTPGAGSAVAIPRRATSAKEPGSAPYLRELQLLIGKQALELELLRTELDALKRKRRSHRASGQ